jgi:hypothetical protein
MLGIIKQVFFLEKKINFEFEFSRFFLIINLIIDFKFNNLKDIKK